MARIRNPENALRWGEILKRQADSGVSVRQFCAAEGVSEPSFYSWRKKLGARSDGGARGQAETSGKDRSDSGRLFVPLRVLDTAQTLEIIHPLGYRIQVTGDVNPVALRHVIEALDERGAR